MNRKKETARELKQLCESVRGLVADKEYSACFGPICQAMEQHPHAPQPHNLLGIVLEKTGDHCSAMRHFRAALALDPTYLPATHNLNTYGTFFSTGSCAFDESDVPPEPPSRVKVEYGAYGIGRIVRR